MTNGYARRLEKMIDRLTIEHTKQLFLQDEMSDEIDELSVGETIGISGERLTVVLDHVNQAEDYLAQAIYCLKQAQKTVK